MSSSSSLLEIVELEDGSVVLRRADGEGESLVQIQFSEETRAFLADASFDVAKVMIGAGVQVVGDMYELNDGDEHSRETGSRMLH
jgi:hypothetical protein